MVKKTTNKKANIAKEENTENTVLDVEKTENVENTALDTENDEDTENTILDVEKKDLDIIRKALEEDASKEDEQTPAITSEEVEQVKPIDDNAEIDATTVYEKIAESAKIGKGEDEKLEEVEDDVENEDSQDIKPNSNDKVNTAKHKISKLFGYYWNGQLMD